MSQIHPQCTRFSIKSYNSRVFLEKLQLIWLVGKLLREIFVQNQHKEAKVEKKSMKLKLLKTFKYEQIPSQSVL